MNVKVSHSMKEETQAVTAVHMQSHTVTRKKRDAYVTHFVILQGSKTMSKAKVENENFSQIIVNDGMITV